MPEQPTCTFTSQHVRERLGRLRDITSTIQHLCTFPRLPADQEERLIAMFGRLGQPGARPTADETVLLFEIDHHFAVQMSDPANPLHVRLAHTVGWLYGTMLKRWDHLFDAVDRDSPSAQAAVLNIESACAIAGTLVEAIAKLTPR